MRAWTGGLIVITAAAVLAACGGGGSTPAPPAATPTPVPTVAPAAIPSGVASVTTSLNSTTSVVMTVPTAPPGGGTPPPIPVPLPSDPSGVGGQLSIPSGGSIPAGTTVNETLAAVPADPSVPVLGVRRRTESATNGRQGLLFLGLRFSRDVTLPQGPRISISFPLPLPTTGVSYYAAFYDPLRPSLGWQYGFEGPAAVATTSSGTVLSFAPSTQPLALAGFTTYYLAVYLQSAAAPPPTPAPIGVATVAPSPTPGAISASPAALAFGATGAAASQRVTLAERGFAGSFALNGASCAGIVSTTPVAGNPAAFDVIAAATGSCQLVGVGDRGASVIIPVTVATSGVGLTIPDVTPSPAPAPSVVSFTVPASLAVNVGPGGPVNNYTVTAGASAGPPVYAVVSDPTIASIQPNVWTSPLPATFTVTGLARGTTSIVVSDGAQNTVSTQLVVGLTTGSITIPTSSPFPLPVFLTATPSVLPSPLVAFGAGATVTVTTSASGYTGPIFASSISTYVARVQPNVWTSPLPATFVIIPSNVGSGGVQFSDIQGRSTFVPVTVVASPTPTPRPSPSPVSSASPSPSAAPTATHT